MKKRLVIWPGLFLAVLILAQAVSAAQLGMNYYHETMMNSAGNHYIERNLQQVSSDLEDIKGITDNVKFYMNPLAKDNLDWVLKVNDVAKQKGMHTVIVMNTEDRTLDDSNWQSYASSVISSCKAFDKKADEFIVGNEFSLHTTLSKEDLQKRAVNLINECKKHFTSSVSYQAFWYEKDNWKGYDGKIYFNLYEDLNKFKTNAIEMSQSFGSNAYVGEFGIELANNGQLNPESQADEIKKRWEILQSTVSPVAYVFTYKEPSASGFGLMDSNGNHLPGWNVLSAASNEIKDLTYVEEMDSSCSGGSVTSDISSGCRSIVCSSSSGSLSVLACNKPDQGTAKYFEMYKQSQSDPKIKICLGDTCIGDNGYARSPDFESPATNLEESNSAIISIAPWYPQARNYIFDCSSNLQSAVYDWSFGDGSKLLGVPNNNIYHSYNSAGNYLVECTARNGQSKVASKMDIQVK